MTSHARPYVDKKLIAKVKVEYPETTSLTPTALVDWALRYLLALRKIYGEKV